MTNYIKTCVTYNTLEEVINAIDPNPIFEFRECTFNCVINPSTIINESTDKLGRCKFINCLFNEDVIFIKYWFCDDSSFSGSIFKKDAIFSKSTFNGDHRYIKTQSDMFNSVKFEKNASFESSLFLNPASFIGCQFNIVTFHKAIFRINAVFNNATFKEHVNFSHTEFEEVFIGWELNFSDGANFSHASFNKKVNLSHLNVTKGTLDFTFSNFEDNVSLYKAKCISNIDMSYCNIEKNAFFLGSKIKKSNRETFRIIKNEFIKQNNRIEALKYHKREMETYLNERTSTLIKDVSFLERLKALGDLILLLFNKYSNGFGLNWFLGILFTFTSTAVIFYWYISNISAPFSIFIKYYPQFILPTHFFNFISEYPPIRSAYIIDFLGRVFSSYGIYQTVQAFRKYGRF